MANTFADTTIQQAQANTLAQITIQVADLNKVLKGNYLGAFNNWASPALSGRSLVGDPPKPPNAFVVGFFDDPTTGPGTAGFYQTVIQWAYPAVGKELVCEMPPLPEVRSNPPGFGLIGIRIFGEWFQALEGDTTPVGAVIPGTSRDNVVGLFLRVGAPVGGGWFQLVSK